MCELRSDVKGLGWDKSALTGIPHVFALMVAELEKNKSGCTNECVNLYGEPVRYYAIAMTLLYVANYVRLKIRTSISSFETLVVQESWLRKYETRSGLALAPVLLRLPNVSTNTSRKVSSYIAMGWLHDELLVGRVDNLRL